MNYNMLDLLLSSIVTQILTAYLGDSPSFSYTKREPDKDNLSLWIRQQGTLAKLHRRHKRAVDFPSVSWCYVISIVFIITIKVQRNVIPYNTNTGILLNTE